MGVPGSLYLSSYSRSMILEAFKFEGLTCQVVERLSVHFRPEINAVLLSPHDRPAYLNSNLINETGSDLNGEISVKI